VVPHPGPEGRPNLCFSKPVAFFPMRGTRTCQPSLEGTAVLVVRARTLGRTWRCDEYLTSVESLMINGGNSLVQAIHHSKNLSHRFEAICASQKAPVWCLRAAQHRYESLATPGGRSVLYIDALIEFADELLTDTNPDHVSKAEHFLASLNTEVCILGQSPMGMHCACGPNRGPHDDSMGQSPVGRRGPNRGPRM
jgi:hypothetical protein